MSRAALRALLLACIAIGSVSIVRDAGAQSTTLPHLDWRTLDTRFFRIHYPRDAEAWTRDVAARIDAAHDAVSAFVGSAPARRITVIVEDPNNLSNGFAIPLLDHPLIFLWPTPPEHASSLANGDWGDLLSIHEYAHIAHLTRESRNPALRRLARLSPVHLGPLAINAPRWVTEGYATFVEGRITASIGRPHGTWRPAVLRQWAIEGQLPSYAALDGSPRFQGGSMAYLAGSAFLEWLAARAGDSSVVHLWRRMSARQPRSFAEAFEGVYGAPPDELYGRFTAELTHDALDVVASDPHGEGELVQRLRWATGAPALSHDDSLLAVVIDNPSRPSRVVVWRLAADTVDSAALARGARERARDPEDVPAVPGRPRPLRVAAVLGPRGGISFADPRFFGDDERILVTALTPRGDGASRRDLYIWSWRTGAVRRVTHGAGIRHADVAPDGASAVADRCVGGRCNLVRVDLATGAITDLTMPQRGFSIDRPRFSRDGRFVTAALEMSGRWSIAVMPVGTMATRMTIRGEGVEPSFADGDSAIVFASDAGGVRNIVRMSIAGDSSRQLTSVTGAALAPEASRDGWVYFLRLHARGLDLARVRLNQGVRVVEMAAGIDRARVRADSSVAAPDPQRAPRPAYPWVTQSTERAARDTLDVSPVGPSRAYGIGPREYRLLASGSWGAEGKSIGLAYAGTDPVGRLTWLLQGQWGTRASWRGGSAGAVYRGIRPLVGLDAFALENQPSRQRGDFTPPSALDARYRGLSAWTSFDDDRRSHGYSARLAASYGSLDPPRAPAAHRVLAQIALGASALQTPGDWRFAEKARVTGEAGRLGGESWKRFIVSGTASATGLGRALALDGSYGRIDKAAILFEQFALGGLPPGLIDPSLLSQRISMPALPVGLATGRSIATARVSLPGPVWRPYYWGGSAGGDLRRWSQVAGVEGEWRTDGIWMLRVPGVRLLGGVGYVVRGPLRHHTQAYVSASYRP